MVDDMMTVMGPLPPLQYSYRLEVFVILSTLERFMPFITKLIRSMWFNQYAKYFIMSPIPEKKTRYRDIANILCRAYEAGLLNAQYIDFDYYMNLVVVDFNPYMAKAPQQWKSSGYLNLYQPFYLFRLPYQKDEHTCEALDFVKTKDLGGTPFEILATNDWHFCQLMKNCTKTGRDYGNPTVVDEIFPLRLQWLVDNIRMALNASVTIKKWQMNIGNNYDISLTPSVVSEYNVIVDTSIMMYTFDQVEIFVTTKHTAHVSQLEKILSVVDEPSRIGMYAVYLITFLFFKFFLRQAVMPAVLNLVRLTCNTGLLNLPNKLAPTIYLACLFMLVINFQAIFTGNLASLLTQTIAYPHVNTKEDIAKLGYTVYASHMYYNSLAADPTIDRHVVRLSKLETCIDYLLRDSLAACPGTDLDVIRSATLYNFHVSRYPMQSEYSYYRMSRWNPLGRRVQGILRKWHEHGLRRKEQGRVVRLLSELVDDNEVKKNVLRRVMNFSDLRFAFVILGIGLSCSLLCFIGELMISYINSKYTKRRNRVRAL